MCSRVAQWPRLRSSRSSSNPGSISRWVCSQATRTLSVTCGPAAREFGRGVRRSISSTECRRGAHRQADRQQGGKSETYPHGQCRVCHERLRRLRWPRGLLHSTCASPESPMHIQSSKTQEAYPGHAERDLWCGTPANRLLAQAESPMQFTTPTSSPGLPSRRRDFRLRSARNHSDGPSFPLLQ